MSLPCVLPTCRLVIASLVCMPWYVRAWIVHVHDSPSLWLRRCSRWCDMTDAVREIYTQVVACGTNYVTCARSKCHWAYVRHMTLWCVTFGMLIRGVFVSISCTCWPSWQLNRSTFAHAVYRRSLALPAPCHLRVSVHCFSVVSAPSACSTFALEKRWSRDATDRSITFGWVFSGEFRFQSIWRVSDREWLLYQLAKWSENEEKEAADPVWHSSDQGSLQRFK